MLNGEMEIVAGLRELQGLQTSANCCNRPVMRHMIVLCVAQCNEGLGSATAVAAMVLEGLSTEALMWY